MNIALSSFKQHLNLYILTNEENLGFVGACNRGLKFFARGDCVLLNSDTTVFAGAWEEFRRIRRDHMEVGTITALSNNATIFSYPHQRLVRSTLPDVSWAEVASEMLAVNSGRIVDVPTGHGFCMFIRREALDEVRELDSRFGRGYGEENDMCRRAADRGWRNVAACGVFVLHHESVSFGEAKVALLAANGAMLQSMYPEYQDTIMRFEAQDGLRSGRWAIDALRLRRAVEGGGRFVVVISNWLEGGTKVAIADHESHAGHGDAKPIRVTIHENGRIEARCALPELLASFLRDEADAFFALLDAAAVEDITVHQLLGFPESFVETLIDYKTRRGSSLRLQFVAHDYYALCQRVTMTDATERFCRAADADVCGRCVQAEGAHSAHRITLKPAAHRQLFARFFGACTSIVSPSEEAAKWIGRVFPAASVDVRPHPDFGWTPAARLRAGDPNQILVIGAISRVKGSRVLLETARLARLYRPELTFHVIGFTDCDNDLRNLPNVRITGSYERENLPKLVDEANGVIALFPYLWPETYSYTLSEAWALGLWPVIPDLGAPPARVRARGVGTVLPDVRAETVLEALGQARNWALDLSRRLPNI